MTQAPEQPTDPSAPSAIDQPGAKPSGAHQTEQSEPVEAHSGQHAVAVAREHGVEVMFTLSGAHVFPMYDGAVTADPPMKILDVRHEQTAAFAAEAMGKLTRKPGLAVLTAGPGVTNGVSAIAQAQFSGSPLVVVGGRAPANRWGTGSLQELDHAPIVAPVSKLARTIHKADEVADGMHEAFTLAGASHRGPVFVDIPMDEFFNSSTSTRPVLGERVRAEPDGDAIADIAELLGQAQRPVLVMGTDVWADGAEEAALRLVEEAGIPSITNGMGRGVIPGGHPLLVTKARGAALGGADLVVVAGTPLDFRLGYGDLRRQGRRHPCARRTPRRLPRTGLPARRPRGRGVGRPHPGPRRAAGRPRQPRTPPRLVRVGEQPAGHREGRHRTRLRAARCRG